MSVAIVGHGPSMLGSCNGELIDSFDFVVRQKALSQGLILNNKKDFGNKVSAICGSWTIKNALFWSYSAQKWVFLDRRHSDVSKAETEKYEKITGARVLKDTCQHWTDLYTNSRSSSYTWSHLDEITTHSTSDDKGVRHLSCGLYTIIYACELLKPKEITLFGFDNIKSGNFTWSLARGPNWKDYPDHRWDTENALIPVIEKVYEVRLKFI